MSAKHRLAYNYLVFHPGIRGLVLVRSNTTNGSWWIGSSPTYTKRSVRIVNTTNGSWWMVQVQPTRQSYSDEILLLRAKRPYSAVLFLCRLDLKPIHQLPLVEFGLFGRL